MEIKSAQVMITGANRGIGRAFAKVCAEDGAHLHLVVRKKESALIKELEASGAASVTLWQADFSKRESIENFAENTAGLKVDILFNNAGMQTSELFEHQKTEAFYDVIQTNLTALIHMTHLFLPGMLKRKRGKIINNSSVLALMPLPQSTTYAASKAGVAFTSALKAEVRGSGVSALLLVTPAIKTRMFEEIEKSYEKSFELPVKPISPQTYARMIREAVLNDLEVVKPSGITGIGLRIAQYVPTLFDWEVRRRFRRAERSESKSKTKG